MKYFDEIKEYEITINQIKLKIYQTLKNYI